MGPSPSPAGDVAANREYAEPMGPSMSTDHPHRYDFFLSFTGVDMTWAEWIADRLTTMEDLHGRPCRVLFQKWDFVPGSNWVDMMDRGVRLCARIVPVLSPDYLDACP